MNIPVITTLLLASILSFSAAANSETSGKDRAAVAQNRGAAAGDVATSYASGNTVVLGVSAVSALGGVAFVSQNAGDGHSRNSTTATTSSIAGK